MKASKVFLLLNGEAPKKLPDFSDYGLICATDGAYHFLKKHQITPHFISGDFDSLKHIPKNIETIETPDQNFTDFDKILRILFDRGFKNITVYGASGVSQDHFLGNLHTAINWKEKLNITFFDDYNRYFLAQPNTAINNCLHKTISLVPLPKATNIVTEGLEYSLQNESLTFGKRIGTRNKAIQNNIKISFNEGNLVVFVSH